MNLVDYPPFGLCLRLANDRVEVLITTTLGPRIIRYGFLEGENEFAEVFNPTQPLDPTEWYLYGGHRLWHAPEVRPRTYVPDNQPVSYEVTAEGVRVIQPVETLTGIQKSLEIWLAPEGSHVRVIHRLHNQGVWEVELAAWAITAMAPGGSAILPLPPRSTHEAYLQPVSALALWAYTDLSDPRWTLGRSYVLARQDPLRSMEQKIGLHTPLGWAAYARRGHLFLKRFEYHPEATYPDWGSTVEVFINDRFLELETLGPLMRLAPGESLEHIEDWYLFDEVPTPHNDQQVERHILPRLLQTGG
ncbi:hypothetical protein [uncultured Thermanaerothrix sp.]|uniref:hypothetical protein n=1 Tax=uncultured Thermanaerothrix sp. TaxID=1195149 RepID=UPI0026113D91|nr:hypothetical protein [uncultured Thermanaerothrix sp.]